MKCLKLILLSALISFSSCDTDEYLYIYQVTYQNGDVVKVPSSHTLSTYGESDDCIAIAGTSNLRGVRSYRLLSKTKLVKIK